MFTPDREGDAESRSAVVALVLGDRRLAARFASTTANRATSVRNMSDLEEALTLRPTSPGNWLAFADPRYESTNAMFGGWTAAILLRAANDHANREGSPASITVN